MLLLYFVFVWNFGCTRKQLICKVLKQIQTNEEIEKCYNITMVEKRNGSRL